MVAYEVHKLKQGENVSLFVKGFPRTVILSNETDQKILAFLYDNGVKGISKKKNGSDNKD